MRARARRAGGNTFADGQGVVLTDWMNANHLGATAIHHWVSVQQNYGCNGCMLMSMMREKLMPSACEVAVTGVLPLYASQLAGRHTYWPVDIRPHHDRRCQREIRGFVGDGELPKDEVKTWQAMVFQKF